MAGAPDVERLRGATVLIVGDVMLDEYVSGDVERISPEAPVPVVRIRDRTHIPGGAANAAAGIVALGGRALVAGVVGRDEAGRRLRRAITAAGVQADGLLEDPSRPTTTKTRVVAHGQQVVRADDEDARALDPEPQRILLDGVAARIASVDAVLISDYAKGVITPALSQAVIALARDAGKPVVVDPKGLDFAKYRGATVTTPNVPDAARAANVHVDGPEDLALVAERLTAACDGAALLLTRGAEGMSLYAGGRRVDIATQARDVFDVTGAGDTVVSVLAVALGRGVALEQAVRWANAAAGLVVAKVGTATVGLGELAAALERA